MSFCLEFIDALYMPIITSVYKGQNYYKNNMIQFLPSSVDNNFLC